MVLASTALLRYNKTVINPYLLFTERISSPYEFKYEKENKIMELFSGIVIVVLLLAVTAAGILYVKIYEPGKRSADLGRLRRNPIRGLLLHVCAGSFPGRHLLYLYWVTMLSAVPIA